MNLFLDELNCNTMPNMIMGKHKDKEHVEYYTL